MKGMRWLGAVLTLLLLAAESAAAKGWANVKAGMSRSEVQAELGEPLVRSSGRGFEVWIYDGCTEVLWLRGAVIAWTPPGEIKDSRGERIDLAGVIEQAKPKPPPVPRYVPRAETPGFQAIRTRARRWQGF